MKKVYITHRGEEVKSYGEQEIADFLDYHNINYWYEVAVQRSDGGFNKPDFYLPDLGIYIEYFGMCHYSKKYDYQIHLKIETFQNLDMKVIRVYPKQVATHTLKTYLNKHCKNLTGRDLLIA